MSHYDVLGASPDASAEELRGHFVQLARRFHPDRQVGAKPSVQRDAELRMRQITEAWAVLGDPYRRRQYDLGLGDRVPGRGDRTERSGARPTGPAPAGAGVGGPRPGRPGPGGSAGGSGLGGAGGRGPGVSGSPNWRDPVLRPGVRVAAGERDWRHYASAGDGGTTRRSLPRLVLVLSPTILLAVAAGFALAGAMVRWNGFWAAALTCALTAGALFFLLPIWAMTKGNAHRRPGRQTRRSY
ncbi:MAG: J domain-containing protein [Acidimicrobiales bacterium]